MKKSLVALAVLGMVAGTAAAQSSVTLFGVVDLAARYTKAGGLNKKELAADGSSSSRLGVRGVEDLGGGLKAGFWLEHSFAGDTGAQGDAARFWGRRATVSLMGGFGEVRLGRAKTSTRLVIDDFDAFSTTGLGDATKIYRTLGGADTYNRADNQVAYIAPNMGGFYASADVGAGENTIGKRYFGFRVGYKAGALNVSGGAQSTQGLLTENVKLAAVGASYDFGMAKVNALVTRNQYMATRQTIVTVGATVPVGASGSFVAQFSNANANTSANEARLLTAGYQHSLSKRTGLYMTVSQIDNEPGANFRLGSSPSGVPAVVGGKYSGFDVGMKHSF